MALGNAHLRGLMRGLLPAALICLLSGTAQAETKTFPNGETQVLGNLNSGDYTATFAGDGSLEKIAEAKDATGHYRLEWRWTFGPIPSGSDFALHMTAQATNTKRGMDHYAIAYQIDDGPWVELGSVDATSMAPYAWTLPALEDGQSLDLRALDTNQVDDLRRANQLSIDELFVLTSGVGPSPLGAPSDLSAGSQTAGEITLQWTDNATGENGFFVERKSTVDPTFAQIADLPADTTQFTDVGLSESETYTYRVCAYDGVNDPACSNEASASPLGDGGPGPSSGGPATDRVIVGYYPSWGIYNARKYWVSYIPFQRVTHVNYAFANVDPTSLTVVVGDTFAEETNGKDPETDNGLPHGNLHQLVHFRDVGHNGPAQDHINIIISIGGWTWSENFSDAALTPESRWRFAESVKDYVATFNLDGADLDWEFPTGDPANCGQDDNVCRAADPVNHALLIMAVRAKLNELDPAKILSIAMPGGLGLVSKVMPPIVDNSRLTEPSGAPMVFMRDPNNPIDSHLVDLGGATALDSLDFIHVMNYDMAGAPWEDHTRHHAALYPYEGPSGDPEEGAFGLVNSHSAIQAYHYVHSDYSGFDPDSPSLDPVHGVGIVPASKLTFGVPLYGRGFKSVDSGAWDGYDGLFQFTDSSSRRRTPRGTWDAGGSLSGAFGYWDILLNHGGDGEAANNNLVPVGPDGMMRAYGPYTFDGNLFIGFDDRQSVDEKLDYLVNEGMAGIMFWGFHRRSLSGPGQPRRRRRSSGLSGQIADPPHGDHLGIDLASALNDCDKNIAPPRTAQACKVAGIVFSKLISDSFLQGRS